MTRQFRDEQWVCTDSAYAMLSAQGYIAHRIEWRGRMRWRLMVLPWERTV